MRIVFVIITIINLTIALKYSDVTPEGDELEETQTEENCPNVCKCEEAVPLGRRVTCKDQGLTDIPESWTKLKEMSFTTYLNLNLNRITNLQPKAFSRFGHLIELHLAGNFIFNLRSNMFSGLKELQEMYIQDNKIKLLPPNVFTKLPKLRKLNLASNFIQYVHDGALNGLSNLEELSFDDNRLSYIPSDAIANLRRLKALDLQINNLTEIPGDAFRGLNLEVLLLSHNKIRYIHNDAFAGQDNILILNLENNNLIDFPRVISHLTSLHTLKLSGNQITAIPEHAFSGNPNLSYLSFSGNPIRIIGGTAFTQLPKLQFLYLENIKDQKLFPNFDGCESLTSLSLTGGQISSIPHDVCSRLTSLVSLSIAGNSLTNFTGLNNCHHLTSLDVSSNLIMNITKYDLYNMKDLQSINLASNKITWIDSDAFAETNLRKMNMAFNYFTYLPVRGLRDLRDLNISGVQTMLYFPPVELLPNLRKLSAFYPYHCCQLTSANKRSSKGSDDQIPFQQQNMFGNQQTGRKMLPYIQCDPEPGPLHPCEDLLPSYGLRGFGWLVLVLAFVLNVLLLAFLVIKFGVRRQRGHGHLPGRAAGRGCFKDLFLNADDFGTNNSTIFLTCNVSLADLSICGYLGIILFYDITNRGSFAEHGAWWQQSNLCYIASFLLVFGTQLTFTTLAIITLERYLVTKYPMDKNKHLRKTALYLTMAASWVFSIVTAIVTLFGGDAYNGNGILPSLSSATCLPWTTELKYILILFVIHVAGCVFASVLCIKMLRQPQKHTWLSQYKNVKWQTVFTFSLNTSIILPLGVIAVYIAVVTGFPTKVDINGVSQSKRAIITGKSYVDMQSILIFVLTVIPLRCLLNILLYIAFNEQYRNFLMRMICIKPSSSTKHPLVGSSEYASEMQSIPTRGSTSYAHHHYDTHTESTGYDTSMSQYTGYIIGNGGPATQSSDCSFTMQSTDVKPLINLNKGFAQYNPAKQSYSDNVLDEIVEDDSSINAQNEFHQLVYKQKLHPRHVNNDLIRTYHGIIGIDKPPRHSSPGRSMRGRANRCEDARSNHESEISSSHSSSGHYDISALNAIRQNNKVKTTEKENVTLHPKTVDPNFNNQILYSSIVKPPKVNLAENKETQQSDFGKLLCSQQSEINDDRVVQNCLHNGVNPEQGKNHVQDRNQRASESYDSSKDSGIHSEVDSNSAASDAGGERIGIIGPKQMSASNSPHLMTQYLGDQSSSTMSTSGEKFLNENMNGTVFIDGNCNTIKYVNPENMGSCRMETSI